MLVGLVGEPGAGKTTIARELDKWHSDFHLIATITVSDLLSDTEKRKVLAEESLVRERVEFALDQNLGEPRNAQVVVLDSMPRSLGQLFWLTKLAHTRGHRLALVFVSPPPGLCLTRLIERDRDHEFLWLERQRQYADEACLIEQYAPSLTLEVTETFSNLNAMIISDWLVANANA